MQRNMWQFQYSAAELCQAAKAKKEHHEARLAWWTRQKEGVLEKIKEGGIEVSESVAAGYSTTKGLDAPQIMVDSDLQRKLTECHVKMRDHTTKIAEYDGWLQIFSKRGTDHFQLNQDDWLFFFGN